MRFTLIIVLILSTCIRLAYAQETDLRLDEDVWRRNAKDMSYTPEQKVEMEERFETSGPPMLDLSDFKYLAYGFVAVVIIVLLTLILKNMRPVEELSGQRVEATSIEEAEENLPMVTLTKIYQEALEANDYKRALRIKFLMILQRLIDTQMIVWKKRKTNEQYLNEINDDVVLVMFQSAVNMFDDVWYGETLLTASLYGQMEEELDHLKNKIGGE